MSFVLSRNIMNVVCMGGRGKMCQVITSFTSCHLTNNSVETYLCKGSFVLKREQGLIAVYKPPHILSQPRPRTTAGEPDESHDDERIAIVNLPYNFEHEYYYNADCDKSKSQEIRYWLLHRLDAETSGILLLSDNECVADYVKCLFSLGRIEKKYYAIVFGKWVSRTKASWITSVNIKKDEKRAIALTKIKSSSGRLARTEVRVAKRIEHKKIMLLELQPRTGITHQLRVQCQHEEVPIVGDRVYGDFSRNKLIRFLGGSKNRLYLHASKLIVPLEAAKQKNAQKISHNEFKAGFEVSSPIPSSFVDLLRSSVP